MGQSYLNELNSDVYTHEPVREEGFTGYRFTSPLVEPGVRVAKTFLLAEQGFAGRLRIQVTNESQFSLTFDSGTGGLGVTLGPGLGLPFDDDNPIARFASVSAVAQTEQEFFYYKMKEPGESQALNTPSLRWGGVASMYYLISLIPDGQTPVTTFKSMIPSELARFIPPQRQKEHLPYYPAAEIYTPPFDLGPGQQFTAGFDLFAGPRQHKVLEQAGHDLDRVMFYDSTRVMRGLCLILMRLLDWFHGLVANWGMAIILLTVFVKLVTFPLVHKGLKSQAKMTAEMNRIKPLIDKLNEKYKDNPQKKQQEMFKLYREHGVNPLGMFKGCIWMAIQIPIFYALYRLLYQSIDLRGASFLWVADLSRPDMLFRLPVALPFIGEWFNLLPLITAASQMAMSKFMTTPPTDPQQAQMQKTMMYFMPVIILFITYRFPSGLMLYWLVSNLWQVLQQVWVNKHIRKPPQASAHAPARASS
ncbi:MAG: Membrane protein insertase YidC [candidate division BRC1 bacterium ADurb.BinA292]|nr:MAG: Membrane protein insertase YidC [candidate division BRC1 bacterium ADurb.BinA292]